MSSRNVCKVRFCTIEHKLVFSRKSTSRPVPGTCTFLKSRAGESRSRLSPIEIGDNPDEIRYTYTHLYVLLDKHLIYIRHKLGYRASDDIRCFLQRPNIVASAISQSVAHIYKTRDRYLHHIRTCMQQLRAVGPKLARRQPISRSLLCARTEFWKIGYRRAGLGPTALSSRTLVDIPYRYLSRV